jgi:glycosyltransferase involved in cell wall biosynthesis
MKKRILFVNDEMTMGGVARILATLLKMIDLERYDVDLLVLHPHGELMSDIPEGVRVLPSTPAFKGVDVVFKSALKRRAYREIIDKLTLFWPMKFTNMKRFIQRERKKMNLQRYDIEVAAKEGFCSIFVAHGDALRKINWIHVDYSQSNYSIHHMTLMKTILQQMDAHIAVSNQAKIAYMDLFGVETVHSIPNVMDTHGIERKLKEHSSQTLDTDQLKLMMVGRLHPQKAMHRAIGAMKNTPKHVHLYIVGDGVLRADLERLTQDLQLSDQVHFLGQQNNPFPMLKQADLFLLPSKYEGYPTTVIEAFMAGVPVLACLVAGVDQQIQEGINGWIVDNDDQAFALKLHELLQSEDQLKQAKKTLHNYRYDNSAYLETFMHVLEGQR